MSGSSVSEPITLYPPQLKLLLPSPIEVLAVGVLIYALIWVAAPIDYAYGGTLKSWGTLLAYSVALSLGSVIGFRRFRRRIVHVLVSPRHVRRAANLLALLGLIGLTALIADRLMRGGSFFANYAANREALAAQTFGPLAVIGQLLGPLLIYLPLILFIKRITGDRQIRDWVFMAIATLYPLLAVILVGSRSLFLVFIMLTAISAWMTGYVRLRIRGILCGALALLVLIWLSGQVFWARTVQLGINPLASLNTSVYAHFAPLDGNVLAFIKQNINSSVGFFAYALANFSQYYTHGVLEFLHLVDVFNSYHTWGGQQIFVPLKLLTAMVGWHGFTTWALGNEVRTGVYTTLLGPIFYDFGPYLGIGFCLLLGYLAGAIGRTVARTSLSWLPLYVYILLLFLFAPVVNLLIYGSGQTNIIAGLLVAMMLSRRRFRVSLGGLSFERFMHTTRNILWGKLH